MSSDLPAKVRVDIRDQWDKPDSSVQKAAEALYKSLGHKIIPVVEWSAIWSEVKDLYQDKSAFVPAISSLVLSWYQVLQSKIEDPASEEWAEELLNVLAEVRDAKLYVEPKGTSLQRPTTSWKSQSKHFILGIPKAPSPSVTHLQTHFNDDFSNMFKSDASPLFTSALPRAARGDDDWADIVSDRDEVCILPDVMPSTPAPLRAAASRDSTPPRLPLVNAILRPEDHFKVTAPYILTVDSYLTMNSNYVLCIHCSHQPSLELIADYFKKWARRSANTTPQSPVLRIELQESPFFFGISDTLIIQPNQHISNGPSPSLLLTFIEGTLSYRLVHTNGSNWVYRRDFPSQ